MRVRPCKDPMQLVEGVACDRVACAEGTTRATADFDSLNSYAIEHAFGAVETVPSGNILASPGPHGYPMVFSEGTRVVPWFLHRGTLLGNNEEVPAIVKGQAKVWRNREGQALVRNLSEPFDPTAAERKSEGTRTYKWLASIGMSRPEAFLSRSGGTFARPVVYWVTLSCTKWKPRAVHIITNGAMELLSRTGRRAIGGNFYVPWVLSDFMLPETLDPGSSNREYLRFLRGALYILEHEHNLKVPFLK